MRKLSKIFVYIVSAVVGLVIGLLFNGSYLEGDLLVDGVSTRGLGEAQLLTAIRANPSKVAYQEALVVNGKRLFVATGSWLTWTFNLLPALLLCLLSFGGLRYLERRRQVVASNSAYPRTSRSR